jgi:hypothetical protein
VNLLYSPIAGRSRRVACRCRCVASIESKHLFRLLKRNTRTIQSDHDLIGNRGSNSVAPELRAEVPTQGPIPRAMVSRLT